MRTSFFFRHGLLPSTALSSTPSLLLAFFVVLAAGFHPHLALWSKSETGIEAKHQQRSWFCWRQWWKQ
jgi:hypothetical protein